MTATPPPPPPPPSYPAPGPGFPAYPSRPQPAYWAAPGPSPGFEYVGFGPRFGGYLIDGLISSLITVAFAVPLFFIPLVNYYQAHPLVAGQTFTIPADIRGRFAVFSLVQAAWSALYFGGLVALYGRTLGQRVVGARVVRAEDGGALPPGRSFLRASIWWGPGIIGLIPVIGSLAGLVAAIGLLSVAWDSRKQGWHDKLARSFVVRPARGFVGGPAARVP